MKIGLFAFLMMFVRIAAAQADGYAGLFTGPSFVDKDYGTRFVIGGHIGGKLTENFALGFYGTYQNMGTGVVGPSANPYLGNVKETILAAEGNFYPNANVPIYLGAKIGLAVSTETISINDGSNPPSNSSQTGADIAVGPAIGVDLPFAVGWSAGGEFNTIFIVSNSDTIHLFNLLGSGLPWGMSINPWPARLSDFWRPSRSVTSCSRIS